MFEKAIGVCIICILKRGHTLTHTLSVPCSLSLSPFLCLSLLKHTHTHTHTMTLSHTYAIIKSLPCSLSLSFFNAHNVFFTNILCCINSLTVSLQQHISLINTPFL